MENEAPNIITWIGYVLPGVSLLGICGAIWWWGKLSGRVERLETDVAELKQEQKRISASLNRLLGSLEKRDGT